MRRVCLNIMTLGDVSVGMSVYGPQGAVIDHRLYGIVTGDMRGVSVSVSGKVMFVEYKGDTTPGLVHITNVRGESLTQREVCVLPLGVVIVWWGVL